ncbi:uncharacterized protein NPIL_676641, partial [Nephila pilipes]
VNRKYFCKSYPHLCRKPSNITSHCEQFPFTCTGNSSYLQFPNVNRTYPYPKEIAEAIREIYLSHNLSDDGQNPWSWSIISTSHLKAILHPLWLHGINVTCYSTNLHFDDDAEFETHEIDQRNIGIKEIHYFNLTVERAESFAPWIPHTVMFFVNSPFVPVSWNTERNSLKYGCTYEVHVILEEEILLPEPYQTNCTDYDALWERNNRTGPRSQEVIEVEGLLDFWTDYAKLLCHWTILYGLVEVKKAAIDPERRHNISTERSLEQF